MPEAPDSPPTPRDGAVGQGEIPGVCLGELAIIPQNRPERKLYNVSMCNHYYFAKIL